MAWVKKSLIAICSLSLLVSFIAVFYYYATTLARIENHPDVINLTTQGVKARLAFGASPQCGDDRHDCWNEASFDDSQWAEALLPKTDIRQLPGFKAHGVQADSMYYRFHVDIPERLLSHTEELSFSPMWVHHSDYEVFLNGRLVYAGNGTSLLGALVNIPIPKSDLHSGKVVIALKGSIIGGDYGIYSLWGGIYLGPKAVLDDLYVADERANKAYYWLLIFCKGSIFIVFSFFFFFTQARLGYFNFLTYAFGVTIENFAVLNLSGNNAFDVAFYFLAKTMAIGALLRFFAEFYQVQRSHAILNIIGASMFTVIGAMAWDFGWGTKTVNTPQLFSLTNFLLLGTLSASIVVGLVDLRLLRKADVDARQRQTIRGFVAVVGIYFTMLVWQVFFTQFRGFDMRAVFDLLFFYYMALVSARHFGFTEVKVVSLEAHMDEKRRMEQELLEAAMIAKAFLPSGTPDWSFGTVSVFHKPISESSGDWYAFEKSPSGRFFHCVLCDITGHGVQAALIVSTCKTVLSGLVHDRPEMLEGTNFLPHYCRALNHTLFEQGGGFHVTTFLGLTFEPEQHKIHYGLGGHPQPLLVKRRKGQTTQVVPLLSRQSVLGIHEKFELVMKSAEFEPGDELVAHTDGVPLGSHGKTIREILGDMTGTHERVPLALYEAIWAAETKKTQRIPDDDVSIVWFKAAA